MMFDTRLLSDARRDMMQKADKGTKCPCCGQVVKVYKRSIYWHMALGLCRLYKLPPGWHHISDLYGKGGDSADFSKLRLWDLIEQKDSDPEDTTKRCSGLYQITDIGREFVEGKRGVKKYVLLLMNEVQSFEGEFVTIHECIKKKFDYAEVMGWS